MCKRLIAPALMIAASAALLLAHGNATHIMGTITGVDGDHLTVKTQEGKSETIMLEKTTKYLTGSKAATVGDLRVGTRVVVDAKMDAKMKMYKAEEIKIGAATAPKADGKAKKSAPAAAHSEHK